MSYSDATQLPDALRAAVEGELREGEHVTWIDQPIASRFLWTALPTLIFAVPWTAFSLFWTWSAYAMTRGRGAAGLAFAAFGLPFVLAGLGMFTSPYWIRRAAQRTLYVLTDRRAIILVPTWRGIRERSFEPAQLHDLRRTQRADGSGDLVFTTELTGYTRGRPLATAIGFQAVPDVRGVEDRVRALAQLGARPA
jgi:hypothetical protein